jgi:hypothetical protein
VGVAFNRLVVHSFIVRGAHGCGVLIDVSLNRISAGNVAYKAAILPPDRAYYGNPRTPRQFGDTAAYGDSRISAKNGKNYLPMTNLPVAL